MKKLFIIFAFIMSFVAQAQQRNPNITEARRSGVQLLKGPPTGILKVEVSEEYHNLVLVYLCGFKGSVPLACREDYNITMTTATGRVVKITNYMDVSFGTIQPSEFPLTIDAKVKGLKGEEKYPFEFSVKLLYKDFCYRITLYDDWTEVKGINK